MAAVERRRLRATTDPFLPDPELTPGDVFDVTIENICRLGYSQKVRAVTKALREQAYRITESRRTLPATISLIT